MPRRRDGNALDASVLEDIDTILNAFEADPLRSLASFRHLAERFRVSDLHLTPRAGGREPGVDETPDSYAMLLFGAVVRRMCDARRRGDLDARLGCLYLLLALFESQPGSPGAPIPILESQWESVRSLMYELRTSRRADGFGALHVLWANGHFVHHKGRTAAATAAAAASSSATSAGPADAPPHTDIGGLSVNAVDVRAELEAETDALRAPSFERVIDEANSSSCAYAHRLEDALPAMSDLHAQYMQALKAIPPTLPQAQGDSRPRLVSPGSATALRAPRVAFEQQPQESVAELLKKELDDYHAGTIAPVDGLNEPSSHDARNQKRKEVRTAGQAAIRIGSDGLPDRSKRSKP